MAKATPKPAARPNIFAKAKTQTVETPKKSKGTVLTLPKDLDAGGNLMGEAALLNNAVHDVIVADQEEKAAKNKGNAAKGVLKSYVLNEWAMEAARIGILPATPVIIQNHTGEAVTYVIQDKTQQNAIAPEQVALLEALLGAEAASGIVTEKTVYAFNPETMEEKAGGKAGENETVADVIFEIVSNAIADSPKLSTEQKEAIVVATTKKLLRRGSYQRMLETCGSNVGKIVSFMEAAGSAIVRYLKS